MKNRNFPPSARYLLVAGLLLSTSVPLLARHNHLPDALTGFMTGIGLALEVMALAKGRRRQRCSEVI